MERSRWLRLAVILAIAISSIASSRGRGALKIKPKDNNAVYNHTLTTIVVHYASVVYISDLTELFTWTCSRCDGVTEGFEVIDVIVDIQHCLQSYVGVAKNLNAIIIAFRGTQERSIQNWIEDLYWKQLDGNYPGMPDAMVHHGFYSAYHNTSIRPGILSAIKKANKYYGDLDIIVTGHSMGGAMASFCGLDLVMEISFPEIMVSYQISACWVNYKAKNVQVISFGQPRVGNAAFASSFSQLVPNTIRVANGHDIVPHLPPYYYYFPRRTYHHFPREVWLYDIGVGSLVYPVEKICDNSGEDPTCSRSVSGNSISDHLVYYDVKMGGDASEACRIVMSPVLGEYQRTDMEGNFVLSRNPASSVLEWKTKSDGGGTTF